MSIPSGNPGQRDLTTVNWGSASSQQEKIKLTKDLADYALTKTHQAVTPILEQAVADQSPQVPRQVVREVVGFAANQAKEKTQEVTHAAIESDYYYGDQDSYISRLTNYKFSK